MVSPNSSETRGWFFRFTSTNGVDDARNVVAICEALRTSLQVHRQAVLIELSNRSTGTDTSAVLAAWTQALDTMIRKASGLKTCSWMVEGTVDISSRLRDGGLRLLLP